jgi:hypothetical protein
MQFLENPNPTGPFAVSPSTSSQTILVANRNRVMASVFNNSSTLLYLVWGSTASNQAFTVKIVPGAHYELPIPTYLGDISVVWDNVGTGAAMVYEHTAR